MRKLYILFVDDEMLFCRTIKRILSYSKWVDKLEIVTACHPFDAELKLKESGLIFDAVIVDYRLEPDNSPEDEKTGLDLINDLKETEQCKKSIYYILSATDVNFNESVIKMSFDKSCDMLKEEVESKIFEYIYNNAKYLPESRTFTQSKTSMFKGDDLGRCLLRYQIYEYLKQPNVLLVTGKKDDVLKLITDIVNKDFIKNNSKQCRQYDLSKGNLDNIILHCSSETNTHFAFCFTGFDAIDTVNQTKLIDWIKLKNIPAILTCKTASCCGDNFKLEEIVCEDDLSIPKLYKILL